LPLPADEGELVSYESAVEPIKLGYLFDFKLPEGFPQEQRDDLVLPFRIVFDDGLAQGLLDRPVEIVFREVEGLPKGSVKKVIDGFGDLVDEGCLAVFGPAITDNAVPTREAIERDFRVPAISVCGAEEWLGEWTFALPQGSMTDEPIYWADLLAERGVTEVGVLIEGSLIGESYARNFGKAAAKRGIRVVAEERIAQTAQDVSAAVARVRDAQAGALVHCGFGFGVVFVNPALRELGWDPPRVMGTAFENAWINPVMWQAIVGWTGLDQYDEGNPVGQEFLDRFEVETGRRPQYCAPVVNRDLATVFLHAFADAHPLTPRGVKDALERVKMVPAASGAPGTYLSFGQWTRRGWMGAGYLVARELDPDGVTSRLVGRFGSTRWI
jgi:ABC-type branched-subunit amino acid transport system substrate-binding protein